MTIQEAMERTENTFQAVKLLDDYELARFIEDTQVEKQTGKIYNIYNLGLDNAAIKAEGGVYTFGKREGLKKEDLTFEEVIKTQSMFVSVNTVIRQGHKHLKGIIRDTPRKTYINPYTGYLHVIYTDGLVKRINLQYGYSHLVGLIDNKIICDFEESPINNKVYYKLIGDNKDILEVVEDAVILYHSIYFLPRKEFMDKLYKAYKDYRVNRIPSGTADALYEIGFTPYIFGMRRREISVEKTPKFIIFSSMNKIRKVKLDQPNFTQKLQKIIIELSL
jgi:hypothetical protein